MLNRVIIVLGITVSLLSAYMFMTFKPYSYPNADKALIEELNEFDHMVTETVSYEITDTELIRINKEASNEVSRKSYPIKDVELLSFGDGSLVSDVKIKTDESKDDLFFYIQGILVGITLIGIGWTIELFTDRNVKDEKSRRDRRFS